MKRTVIAAGVLTALVFGTVAYANGATGDVTVSATVSPHLTLTIPTSTVGLGSLTPGNTTSGTSVITVKSNKAYTFSGAATGDLDSYLLSTYTSAGSDMGVTLSDPQTDGTSFSDTSVVKGVTNITATYTLDLTNAWDLDPNSYSRTYTYTAVQNS